MGNLRERLAARLADLKLFLVRLADECATTFVLTGGLVVVSTGDVSKAGLLAAGVAGARAVFGLLAKQVGKDKQKPGLSK